MENTPRRSMSPRRRLRIWEAHKGRCHICDQPIQTGEPWDVEHIRPLALGGEDTDANCAPAHRKCHRGKGDATRIAKAKRSKARHIGVVKDGPRMPRRDFPMTRSRAEKLAKRVRKDELPTLPQRQIYKEAR